MIAVFS